MSCRFLSASHVLAAAVAVAAVVPVWGQTKAAPAAHSGAAKKSPVAAKAPVAKTSAAKAPVMRTPWGDPDLQGVWNDATSTPLERPGEVGAKDVLDDEEAAEFQKELAYDLTRERRDGG
jgi:hypothetical protein